MVIVAIGGLPGLKFETGGTQCIGDGEQLGYVSQVRVELQNADREHWDSQESTQCLPQICAEWRGGYYLRPECPGGEDSADSANRGLRCRRGAAGSCGNLEAS